MEDREVASWSFRLQRRRSDSYLSRLMVGRSHSSRLVLDSVPPEFAASASYERLSRSLRLFEDNHDEPPAAARYRHHRHLKGKGPRMWRLLTRVFSTKKDRAGGPTEAAADAAEEKSKRSAWLPDPNRRWPVQGW